MRQFIAASALAVLATIVAVGYSSGASRSIPAESPEPVAFSTEVSLAQPINEKNEMPSTSKSDAEGISFPCMADYPGGDANRDGIVDNADLALISSNLNKKGKDAPGDLNGDARVNTDDFTIVVETFGRERCPQKIESGNEEASQ